MKLSVLRVGDQAEEKKKKNAFFYKSGALFNSTLYAISLFLF